MEMTPVLVATAHYMNIAAIGKAHMRPSVTTAYIVHRSSSSMSAWDKSLGEYQANTIDHGRNLWTHKILIPRPPCQKKPLVMSFPPQLQLVQVPDIPDKFDNPLATYW
jgi:hypothetical protein